MNADYPRWMFHAKYEPLIVDNEEQEAALGPGWTRTIQARVTLTDDDVAALKETAALPPEEKPLPKPKPGEEPDRYDDEPDEKPEDQPQERKRPITEAPRKRRKA